ncbi:hypothetical protein N7470_007833 [Penicillium chermesinum]|nr:hypothetical protein N7470_007833 [Penicillium chermesinum]
MDPDEEAKHISFTRDLARYFARCWATPRSMGSQTRIEYQAEVSHRLAVLKASPSAAVPISIISELEDILPLRQWISSNTYEITGIVDWSLGAVQPFGMELDCLFLMTGLSGIEDDDGLHRENIRSMAEEEGKIGVILRYAFERKADGGPSDVLSISDVMWRMLKAWLNVKTT